jgi:hypothetical protein
MRRLLSKRDYLSSTTLSGWDKAIADAKKGLARLKAAIDDCEAKKAAGEPWPGKQNME